MLYLYGHANKACSCFKAIHLTAAPQTVEVVWVTEHPGT